MSWINEVTSCLQSINLIEAGSTIDPDESLFDLGVIDSLGLATLVSALEVRFAIKIPEVDLLPSNFDTINGIASYVASKQPEAATN